MRHRLMTEQEKADIMMKAFELEDAGQKDEALELKKTVPLPAYLAKFAKEKFGVEFLINGGWNLAEAEAEYGQGWLAV